MRLRKKAKSGEESYWKSFTDIMAGLLMVILLVMMLLLLYMTQMDKESHKDDHQYDYSRPYDDNDYKGNEDHKDDNMYERPPQEALTIPAIPTVVERITITVMIRLRYLSPLLMRKPEKRSKKPALPSNSITAETRPERRPSSIHIIRPRLRIKILRQPPQVSFSCRKRSPSDGIPCTI